MVETCVRCDVENNEVRLYDAIYDGRMSSICERCSIIENIPIIKRPDASQLKESEKGVGVYPRMKRLAGIKDERPEEGYFREDKLKELEKQPELELPEREKLNLIEHFHWEIMKNRRRKGLSHQKLAEVLGESEVVVQMIEKGKLPENAESLIRKLEQFFQTKLRKITDTDRFLNRRRRVGGPILLNEKGEELIEIPEEKIEIIPEKEKEKEDEIDDLDEPETEVKIEIIEMPEEIEIIDEPEDKLGLDLEKGEFDIDKANLRDVNISDLRELNRKKVEATRREQIEEQRKIEERNRLIEARKEEMRLMKEKETSELDDVLGGTELIGGNPEREKEFSKEEFDEELI